MRRNKYIIHAFVQYDAVRCFNYSSIDRLKSISSRKKSKFSHETVLWLHLLNCSWHPRALFDLFSSGTEFRRNESRVREREKKKHSNHFFLQRRGEKNSIERFEKSSDWRRKKTIMVSILLDSRTRKENVLSSLLKDICTTLQWLLPTQVRVESNVNCIILLMKHLSF